MSVKQDGEQQGIHSVEHLLAVEVIGQNRPDRARVIEAILQRNDGWRRAERDDLVGGLGETAPLDRVLEHVDAHRRHVEQRGDQVVRERRVAHEPVDHLDLLHHRESEALGAAAVDLAEHGVGVHPEADGLDGHHDVGEEHGGVDPVAASFAHQALAIVSMLLNEWV